MSPSAKRTKIEKVDTGIEEKEDAQQTQKEQQELLKLHYELLPDILSFVIQNTADFAYLRRVSTSWNQHVLPYCLGLSCKNKTNGIYLEPYFRDKKFLNEFVGGIPWEKSTWGLRGICFCVNLPSIRVIPWKLLHILIYMYERMSYVLN